jgi:hypothetical protein
MGHTSIVYGIILGERWKMEDSWRLHRLNIDVINQLPESDDWPFLIRRMFPVLEAPTEVVRQGYYRSQPIHFGATFKEIEWSWDEWLAKFEQLLTQLYWDETYLHLRTEVVGYYDYTYRALNTSDRLYKHEPPLPVDSWKFMGGPRKFDWANPVYDPTDVTREWVFANGVWTVVENPPNEGLT